MFHDLVGVFKTRNAEYGIRNTEYGISKMAARDEAVSSFCARRHMYLEYVVCTYFSSAQIDYRIRPVELFWRCEFIVDRRPSTIGGENISVTSVHERNALSKGLCSVPCNTWYTVGMAEDYAWDSPGTSTSVYPTRKKSRYMYYIFAATLLHCS